MEGREMTVCVEVTFWHDNLPPHQVTNILRQSPTRTWHKGEPSSSQTTLVIPTNGWTFTTEATVDADDLERHVLYIVAWFEARHDPIDYLRREGWDCGITMVISTSEWAFEVELAADTLRRLGSLGLPASILCHRGPQP